jgi:hypothetical protein
MFMKLSVRFMAQCNDYAKQQFHHKVPITLTRIALSHRILAPVLTARRLTPQRGSTLDNKYQRR